MNKQASQVHSFIGPRRFTADDKGALDMAALGMDVAEYKSLERLGIGIDGPLGGQVREMARALAADSIQALTTVASINTPVQFLQNWLPGFVMVITAARKIDELVGMATIGSWEDEEIVQGIMELTGTAVPYGDYTNVPLSSWNVNFEIRNVVRFEEGNFVGRLEEARAARMRVNSGESKREASAEVLEIQRNGIGFFGYNDGANKTYGFLNDPNLPAYITVADSGTNSSTLWSQKTFLEICADIRTAIVQLRTQSKDRIDPESLQLTLALPTDAVDYLSVTSDFGISVREWMKEAYPKIRVVSAPELNQANSGDNVLYLYAERVPDNSTDGGATFIQVVPAKFMVVGVAKTAKGSEEDYSNATAGLMLKRPYAVVRYTGI